MSNHGQPSEAKFRGFASKEAFEAGYHFLWENDIEFDADASKSIWPQAYEHLADTLGVDGAVV